MTTSLRPLYSASWALIIGVNAYQNVAPLAYAANDADSIAAALTREHGFTESNVTILMDGEATRDAILRAYLAFADRIQSNDDRLLLFFAGHGMTLPGHKGPVGYLVPVDGDPERSASLIRMDDLTRHTDRIAAKHVLFIIDACFSGLAFRRAAYASPERFLSDMLQRRAIQAIAAGKSDQSVADGGGPDGKNSIFTGHLLKGLQGAAAESGVLTANSLMHYVYDKVATDPQSSQTPHYGHIDGDGDFVFSARNHDLHAAMSMDELVSVPQGSPPPAGLESPPAPSPAPSFIEPNGYADPNSANFGRNVLSRRLGSVDYDQSAENVAMSWLALVLQPVTNQPLRVDLVKVAERYRQYMPEGTEPSSRFRLPRTLMTTIDSVVLYNTLSGGSEYWASFLRIDKSGALEFCDSYNSFYDYRDVRAFRFVQIVGMTWQFLCFSTRALLDLGYRGGARFLVNIVGSRETILADFAEPPGKDSKYWSEPSSSTPLGSAPKHLHLTCPTANLQMSYDVVLPLVTSDIPRKVVDSMVDQMGLAYNHQSEPRCYIYGTRNFPWAQYEQQNRHS